MFSARMMRARTSPANGLKMRAGGLYGGFLLSGVIAVLLGPILPELEARWGAARDE
ncbi:MAG: hypothetical protein HC786_00875 [Richelia sp. CSU_2_1]|nr:hypothetical protein [Richelia sp. CSU_2_1]